MSKVQLIPLADKIVVRRDEAESQTRSGILLPDNAKEKPRRGRVLAVGTGKCDSKGNSVPMEVKDGDVILFGAYAGTEVDVEGAKYLILVQDDVLAILK